MAPPGLLSFSDLAAPPSGMQQHVPPVAVPAVISSGESRSAARPRAAGKRRTSATAPSHPGTTYETNIKLMKKGLHHIPVEVFDASAHLHFLNLCRNEIETIPPAIRSFASLVELNLGRNRLDEVPRELTELTSLVRLDLSSNRLRKLPQGFHRLTMLQQLQLNGNDLHEIPEDVFKLPMMLKLYVGSNAITEVSPEIRRLRNLEVLYLGGNLLTGLPVEVTELLNLSLLYLGDNRLSAIPPEISRLMSLRTLNLHNNKFRYLPEEIMRMSNLENLSLRGNPLIVDFVNTPIYEPLSLKELAGRAVKNFRIDTSRRVMPAELRHFLDGARRCNNPKCAGVYFQSSVKNLQVVDFCGKFRVPLLKFLCEEKCTDEASAAHPTCVAAPKREPQPCLKKMKRVLMDNYEYECDCIACTN